jgi:hypothetical protein
MSRQLSCRAREAWGDWGGMLAGAAAAGYRTHCGISWTVHPVFELPLLGVSLIPTIFDLETAVGGQEIWQVSA